MENKIENTMEGSMESNMGNKVEGTMDETMKINMDNKMDSNMDNNEGKFNNAPAAQKKGVRWGDKSVTRKFLTIALAISLALNIVLTAGVAKLLGHNRGFDRGRFGKAGNEQHFDNSRGGRKNMMPPSGNQQPGNMQNQQPGDQQSQQPGDQQDQQNQQSEDAGSSEQKSAKSA